MTITIDPDKARAFDGKRSKNSTSRIAAPFEVLLASAPELASFYAMSVIAGYDDRAIWQTSMVSGRYLREGEPVAAGDIVRVASPMVAGGTAWALVIAADSGTIQEAIVPIDYVFHRVPASPGTVTHAWRAEPTYLFDETSPRGRFWGPAMSRLRELVSDQLVMTEREFFGHVFARTGMAVDDVKSAVEKLGSELRPLSGSQLEPGDLVFNADHSRCAVVLANHTDVMSWNFSMENYSTVAPLVDLAPAFVWSPGGAESGGSASGASEHSGGEPAPGPEGKITTQSTSTERAPQDNFGWNPNELQGFAHYRFEPGAAQEFRVGPGGQCFVDGAGRAAMLRGFNVGACAKRAPYLPVVPIGALTPDGMAHALAQVAPQLDLLRAVGCNVVRLLVIWKALEPEPVDINADALHPSGQAYLRLLGQVIDALAQRGMFCFLDFHQDIAHEVYGGDGFPDWALHVDWDHVHPAPQGFDNMSWQSLYYEFPVPLLDHIINPVARLVCRTLRSFWENRLTNTERHFENFPVQDHLVHAIGQVAKFFRGHRAILGYEAFNEPPQAGIDRTQFETKFLPAYYSKVHAAVRRHDPAPFIFLEPRVDWNVFPIVGLSPVGFTLDPITVLGVTATDGRAHYDNHPGPDGRVVFSFHHYDPWTIAWGNFTLKDDMRNKVKEWPKIYDMMLGAAHQRGMIPFLTELGGSQQWARHATDVHPEVYGNQIRTYMDLQYQQVERHKLNTTYWNYDLYNTAEHQDGWNREDFSLLGPNRAPRNIDIVARPYPMRSTAMPGRIAFDLATKVASMTFLNVTSNLPTVIFVPRDIHYPGNNFFVRSTSPLVRWDPQAQLLYFLPDKRLAQNLVVISPRPEADPGTPEARAALPHATYVFSARDHV